MSTLGELGRPEKGVLRGAQGPSQPGTGERERQAVQRRVRILPLTGLSASRTLSQGRRG